MMKERPARNRAPQILSGWKEIAKYLGKGVRTVQRYERRLGLPVRRPAGKPWAAVIATVAELDAWVSASPIREVFWLSPRDVENEFGFMTKGIRLGLAEMARLREQMSALRQEVTASVTVLKSNVRDLQGSVNQHWWIEADSEPLSNGNTGSEQMRHSVTLLAERVKPAKAS